MADFKEGDVVRLKSDGPKMTVVGVNQTTVQCTFFDGNNNLQNKHFNPSTLVKVESNND